MGFSLSSSTPTILGKLTPFGRAALVSTNNALITSFSLGDSFANYNTNNTLSSGYVPQFGGNVSATANVLSNSVAPSVAIKYPIIVNTSGALTKAVDPSSITISTQAVSLGQVTVSGTGLTQNITTRTNLTDPLINLFSVFGLPLGTTDSAIYTSIPSANGGFSDTALSALSASTMIVFSINNASQGELVDGKQVQLVLPTSAQTYTIYSTFQNTGVKLQTQDGNLVETSQALAFLGNNISFLFSDNIQKPNGNSLLSWGTGSLVTTKQFTNNNKQLFNLLTRPSLGIIADKPVGIAALDKGLIAIFDPTIVANYQAATSVASAATLTFNSVSFDVFQVINCQLGRGEFIGSTNPSFTPNDSPRISEIGLYDKFGNLIAIATPDRQIVKDPNNIMAVGVKIGL